MAVLSEIVIVLLYVPRFGSLASLESLVVMNIPVSPVSNIPMAARYWSLKISKCAVSCLLKVCVVLTGSLTCTLQPLLYSLDMVWTGEGDLSMWWLS